jgi:hypothetical protein
VVVFAKPGRRDLYHQVIDHRRRRVAATKDNSSRRSIQVRTPLASIGALGFLHRVKGISLTKPQARLMDIAGYDRLSPLS